MHWFNATKADVELVSYISSSFDDFTIMKDDSANNTSMWVKEDDMSIAINEEAETAVSFTFINETEMVFWQLMDGESSHADIFIHYERAETVVEVEKKTYNYLHHGKDWEFDYPDCGREFQAPVNLLSPRSQYGNSYKFYSFSEDDLLFEYHDLEDIEMELFPDIHKVEYVLKHDLGY